MPKPSLIDSSKGGYKRPFFRNKGRNQLVGGNIKGGVL